MTKRSALATSEAPTPIGVAKASTPDPLARPAAAAVRLRASRWLAFVALLALAAWQAPVFAGDPYVIDPAFPWHGFNPNNFAVSATLPNQSSAGKKIARLSDGTLVVASLVKKLDGTQVNSLWNIGLTRYDPVSGLALPWPNRTPAYNGLRPWDIVFPNSATAKVGWIQSVKVLDGNILVAINWHHSSSDIDVRVLVFGEDGSYKSDFLAFGALVAEYVGGMDVYQTTSSNGPEIIRTNAVVVAATKAGSPPRSVFKRLELNANGTLTDKTGVVALDTHYCAATTRDCEPAGVAAGSQLLMSMAPKIYVLNRVFESGKGYFMVTRVSANGVADPSWSGQRIGGIAGTSLWAEAIAVRSLFTPQGLQDEIFVASERTRTCRNGMEVDRLGNTGANTHWTDVGGSDLADPSLCIALSTTSSYPTSLALDGDRLALAGFDVTHQLFGAEDDVDVAFTILDVSNGGLSLQNKQVFPYGDGITRFAHSGAWGVTPTDGGNFALAGDARYFLTEADGSASKTTSFLLGVMPDDRIFSDDFGDPDIP
jgi:hypothetical protein